MLMSQENLHEEVIDIKNIPNGIEGELNTHESIHIINITSNITKQSNNNEPKYVDNYNSSNSASPISKKKMNIKDFDKVSELGRGAYAKVDLRKSRINNRLIAIKILNKHFMEKLNKTHEAYIEKEILSSINHPNIIKLLSTFQDRNKLYFVLEYASNRDLASFIRSQGILSYELARFYTAEILNALEYLHNKKITHRDLKPENIILNKEMHVKIIDFGTASIGGMYFCRKEMKFKPKNGGNNEEDEYIHHGSTSFDITKYEDYIRYTNSSSFVGTAEYASPELLKNSIKNSNSVDIWALGCILYKFFHGKTPFVANNDIQIFNNVINMDYEISKDLPHDVRDLISKLLVKDPEKRLGVGEKGTEFDFQTLKSHEFFKDIIFEDLHLQNPPIKIENISPYNSFRDNLKVTSSSISNKYRSSDLSEINLNLSDNNISYFDTTDILLSSPITNHRRHHSYNSIINLELCEFSYDTFIDNCFLIEDYIKVNEDNHKEISVVHEKIVKKRGWIIYTVVKMRLLSNGRLETLDVYSNELLECIFVNNKTKIKILDVSTFEIQTNKKRFVFKSSESDVKMWNLQIKKFINP